MSFDEYQLNAALEKHHLLSGESDRPLALWCHRAGQKFAGKRNNPDFLVVDPSSSELQVWESKRFIDSPSERLVADCLIEVMFHAEVLESHVRLHDGDVPATLSEVCWYHGRLSKVGGREREHCGFRAVCEDAGVPVHSKGGARPFPTALVLETPACIEARYSGA